MERLLSYDRLIAAHRNKLDFKGFPDNKLKMAYLDNKYAQFQFYFESDDIELIIKSLKEIYNQLQLGDEVYKYAIVNENQILNYIFKFLFLDRQDKQVTSTLTDDESYSDSCKQIRTLASCCFRQFCLILKVKQLVHYLDYLKDIYKTFDDECLEFKINVFKGLIYYAQSRYGIDRLLENNVLQQIINRMDIEQSHIVLNLILTLDNEILAGEGAPISALNYGIIKILKKFLKNEEVLENVILNFGSLSLCEEGKLQCVEEGTLIKSIIYYLDDFSNVPVLIACSRFLNSVSILKRGKVEIYDNKGIEMCINLLENFSNIQLIINILQLLANLAEEPRGRKKISQNYLSLIEEYLNDNNNFIKEQAKITRDIIIWKP